MLKLSKAVLALRGFWATGDIRSLWEMCLRATGETIPEFSVDENSVREIACFVSW